MTVGRSIEKAAAGNTHPRKKKKERRARKGPFSLWKLQLLSKTFVLLRQHQTFVILSKLRGKKPIVAQKKKMRLASKFPTKLLFLIIVSNFGNFKILSKGVNKKRRFLASFLIGNSWQNQWNGFFLLKSK